MPNKNPQLHPENLIPANKRSLEEVRNNARKGGIKSGKVRKEKKLISEAYKKTLCEKYKIRGKDLSFDEIVGQMSVNIIKKCNSASVSMMKEIREATEGTNVNLNSQFNISPEQEEMFKAILEKHGIKTND